MTSRPDSVFSLGMDEGVDFEVGEDGGLGRQVVIREIFAFEVKFYGLFQVHCQFVERFTLRNHWEVNAFSDVIFLAFINMKLNNLFHIVTLTHMLKEVK